MPLNKKNINDRLDAIQNHPSLSSNVDATALALSENQFAKKATLLGSEAGGVFGGIEGLENKVDNAGSPALGDAMCSFGDDVTGLSGVPDPTSIELDLSVPTITATVVTDNDSYGASETTITAGATENQPVSSVVQQLTGLGAPTAKLETQTLGGSSLDAIDATASDVEGKSGSLKSKIQGVAAEAKAASGTGGGASGGLSAITDVLKKSETMVKDIISEVSAIPSLNANAPDLSNVKNVVGSIDDIKNNVNSISASADNIANEITNGINGIAELQKAQGELETFTQRQPVKTGFGILQDIAEDITNDATALIRGFSSNAKLAKDKVSSIVQSALGGDLNKASQDIVKSDPTISKEMKVVIGSIEGDLSNDEFAKELRSKAAAANIPQEEIDNTESRIFASAEELGQLDTTISGTLVTPADQFAVKEYDISDTLKQFESQQSALEAFTYIDSKEELGTSFRSINREITELILHASETYTNQNIGSEELHVEHVAAGEDGLKYHLVIRRDGKLQRGRPFDKISETNGTNGHGPNAIDVCLVGGLNCSTGCDDPLSYRSSQSFTREQMTTFEAVCEAFYRRYHGGQIFGHREIQPLVEDPYFDVSDYVETVFRKKLVYEDLIEDKVMKSSELITKKPQ
jgi:N-acetylmuramoyl-L-alanine amidase